jgi:hypothetical protein
VVTVEPRIERKSHDSQFKDNTRAKIG